LAAASLPGLTLRLVCDWFPELGPAIAVEHRTWSEATEAEDLAEADVGISWLPDHPWSRGKCGLKLLQYMAAGLPVVANPVGVHCRLIDHGRTGFLAETADQWAAAIGRLAASPALRVEMGRAARQFVAEHYSVARWADFLPSLLERLTGVPGAGKSL
jgi:glycosyltransferase involved in cell wall biosynthesis